MKKRPIIQGANNKDDKASNTRELEYQLAAILYRLYAETQHDQELQQQDPEKETQDSWSVSGEVEFGWGKVPRFALDTI